MSAAEKLFLEAWNLYGFANSDITPQLPVDSNRKWRFDFAFPSRRVAVEVDGRGRHQTVVGVRSDCEKNNTAIELGWVVLRIPTSDLTGKNRWGEPLLPIFIEQLCRILTKREVYATQGSIPESLGEVQSLPPSQGSKAPRSLRGEIPADVLLIGEAPGEMEDKLGQPFIGRSGHTLRTAIQRLGIRSYCITNVVCCIPWRYPDQKADVVGPKVRVPSREEAEACKNHIIELVDLCSPKLVVLLGNEARDKFPFDKDSFPTPLTQLRHPSYINRRGGIDSIEFKRFLDEFDTTLTRLNIPHISPFQPQEV